MNDWSDGYMTDVGYTHGYYTELNPLRARLALLSAGLVTPEFKTACELGYGQGVSVNIHDAASQTDWYGTDFNPAHAGFAQELAAGTPLAGRLRDDAFADFCLRSDLPEFDYIGLHGIWSWVSDANRTIVADFIKRKLKVGGVLYISYNTQPGWAPLLPIRDLLNGYGNTLSAPGTDMTKRIDESLDFADRLMASGAIYGQANPHVTEHLKSMRKHDRHYLAHEYFNRDWAPMPFSRMADWLEPLKLQFAGSAHFLDRISALNLTQQQQAMLDEISEPNFRELVRDFMVNQRFRRDYWVRGLRRMTPLEQAESLRGERIVLSKAVSRIDLSIGTARGTASLDKKVYAPILEQLADHRPRSLADIEHAVAPHGVNWRQLAEAVTVLTGMGFLHPAFTDDVVAANRLASDALNAKLLHRARNSDAIAYLASPVTGGAMQVGRLDQLFLLARQEGAATAEEWGRYADQLFTAQGQRIVRNGQAIESREAQLDHPISLAAKMHEEALPIYRALGLIH